MNKKAVCILLIVTLTIAILATLLYMQILPFFWLVSPSCQIQVLDQYYQPVAGVVVTIKATPSGNPTDKSTWGTFHYLGDVDMINNRITEDDVNLINANFGKRVDWYDLDQDGIVDMDDIEIAAKDVGLILNVDPLLKSKVTDSQGIVTFDVVSTNKNFAKMYDVEVTNPAGAIIIEPKKDYIDDIFKSYHAIYVTRKYAPEAAFTYYPLTPNVGETVTFDGSVSKDKDGTIVKYQWEFDGVKDSRETSIITKTFSSVGSHTVKLTVTDNDGLTGTTSKTILVYQKPVAVISAPSSAGVGDNVKFDGSNSYDPDGGTIQNYKWTIEGKQLTGKTVYYTFSSAGTKTVQLIVTDDEGRDSDPSYHTISIVSGVVARFTYTPTPFAYWGETVTFDGSSSSGTGLKYTWDFGDYTTGSGAVTSHIYSGSGEQYFTVTLKVTDQYGYSASTSQVVKVVDRPQASFTYTGTLKVNSPITFDGSSSKGSSTITYSWDFGDGATANGKVVSHTYTKASTYTVKLTVKDERTSSQTQQLLTISEGPPELSVLTLLEFPPSSEVNVQVLVKSKATGNPISGVTVTMQIKDKPEANYAGTIKSSVTDSNGIATIQFLSPPSSLYTYNVSFSCLEASLNMLLKVLPQILVKTVQFNYEQTYSPGDYDFIYMGQTIDRETGVLISDCAVTFKQVKDDKGNIIRDEYTFYTSSGGAFTFKAKVYDYFASVNPAFNYEPKTLTLTMTFAKSGYVKGTLNVTAKIGPPSILAVISSTSISVGTSSLKIAFKDKQGNPYIGLTGSNVEVVITTPSGTTLSTLRELRDKYYFDDATKTITVSYTFTETGTYKVTVNYVNLPFPQSSQTFNVNVSEANVVPPILTNPYVIGFIVLIIIIILLRRKRSGVNE